MVFSMAAGLRVGVISCGTGAAGIPLLVIDATGAAALDVRDLAVDDRENKCDQGSVRMSRSIDPSDPVTFVRCTQELFEPGA